MPSFHEIYRQRIHLPDVEKIFKKSYDINKKKKVRADGMGERVRTLAIFEGSISRVIFLRSHKTYRIFDRKQRGETPRREKQKTISDMPCHSLMQMNRCVKFSFLYFASLKK